MSTHGSAETDQTSLYLQMLSSESQPAMHPQGILLIILSSFAIFLDIPSLIWHATKRNIAVTTLIVWLILLNIMNFINAFIWPNDNLPSRWQGTGLCDVEVKLMIGSYLGLPGALACIMRSLVAVLDTNSASMVPSAGKKRRNTAFMLIFCFGLPVYVMTVHYVVQPNRYAVWAISGCNPTTDGSWLALFLIYLWPVILSFLDAYYAVFLITRMQRYHAEFSRLLENSNTTRSRFLRLFLISIILVLIVFPLQLYILYRNVDSGVLQFSWSKTHSKDWHYIMPVPTDGNVMFDRWIRVGAGYLVFAFFGVGRDATTMYRNWARKFGLGRFLSRSNTRALSSSSSSRRAWFGLNSKTKSSSSTRNLADKHKYGNPSSSPNNSRNTDGKTLQEKDLLSSGTDKDILSISDGDTSSSDVFIHEIKEIWLEREEV